MSDFQSLSEDSLRILGVLSLLAPDGAPESIFAVKPDIIDLPAHLQFCTDQSQYVVFSHLRLSTLLGKLPTKANLLDTEYPTSLKN